MAAVRDDELGALVTNVEKAARRFMQHDRRCAQYGNGANPGQ